MSASSGTQALQGTGARYQSLWGPTTSSLNLSCQRLVTTPAAYDMGGGMHLQASPPPSGPQVHRRFAIAQAVSDMGRGCTCRWIPSSGTLSKSHGDHERGGGPALQGNRPTHGGEAIAMTSTLRKPTCTVFARQAERGERPGQALRLAGLRLAVAFYKQAGADAYSPTAPLPALPQSHSSSKTGIAT